MCIHDQYLYCIQSLMQDLDLDGDMNEWMYKVAETLQTSKNITDI